MQLIKLTLLTGVFFLVPMLVMAAAETGSNDPTVGDPPTDPKGTIFDSEKYLQFYPSDNSYNDVKNSSIKQLTYISEANNPAAIAYNFINLALGFLGMLSMMMMAYAGIVWFKSGDNEEDVQKAKDIIKGAVIGLLITLLSLGTSVYLFYFVIQATTT